LPVALFSNGRVALPSAAGRPGTHTPRSLRSRSQARLATPIVRTGGGRRSGWGGATATPPGFKLRPRAWGGGGARSGHRLPARAGRCCRARAQRFHH
jgi:hypothetical protein